jgi:DNA-binding MarR family transcriptional regulator
MKKLVYSKGGLALMKEKDLHLAESIESLINVLGRLRKSILKKSYLTKHGLDLTIAQYRVLYILFNSGPCKMTELGDLINTSYGSLTVMIDRLVEKGLVERSFVPKDRRVVIVKITQDGILEYNKFRNIFLSTLVKYISKLDCSKRASMVKAICEITNIINDYFI